VVALLVLLSLVVQRKHDVNDTKSAYAWTFGTNYTTRACVARMFVYILSECLQR